jgi:hypothetical protein
MGHLLEIHNIIHVITHRDEEIKEQFLSFLLAFVTARNYVCALTPPISISVCMVPLRLNVFRLRMIRAR